jgi:hypothetical protein
VRRLAVVLLVLVAWKTKCPKISIPFSAPDSVIAVSPTFYYFLTRDIFTMKFSALAALSLVIGPVAAEVYLKEDFNDAVSFAGWKQKISDVILSNASPREILS